MFVLRLCERMQVCVCAWMCECVYVYLYAPARASRRTSGWAGRQTCMYGGGGGGCGEGRRLGGGHGPAPAHRPPEVPAPVCPRACPPPPHTAALHPWCVVGGPERPPHCSHCGHIVVSGTTSGQTLRRDPMRIIVRFCRLMGVQVEAVGKQPVNGTQRFFLLESFGITSGQG